VPLIGLVAALVLAAPAAAADGPPTLRVKSAKTVVRATLGSFCWVGTESALCADAAYPLKTEGAVPYRARAPFVIGTSEPVDTLTVCLANERDVPTAVCLAVARGSDGKWRGRFPKNLRGAKRLSLSVTAGNSDAHYAAALAR
jgi:hypothetical protein